MSTLESIFWHVLGYSAMPVIICWFPWGCRRLNWLTRHDQRQIGMRERKSGAICTGFLCPFGWAFRYRELIVLLAIAHNHIKHLAI